MCPQINQLFLGGTFACGSERHKHGLTAGNQFDCSDKSRDDMANDLWEAVVDAGTGANLEAEFYASIQQMILKMAGNDCHANFVNYLKASRNLTIWTHFLCRQLEILLGYKSCLPLSNGSEAPALTNLEQHEIVLKTYLADWISNFDNSGQRMTYTTLTTI